jgi:AGCS family alanine or glycine:cation symporter
MVVPNIIGVVLLSPVISRELKKYMKAISVKHDALDDGAEDLTKHM